MPRGLAWVGFVAFAGVVVGCASSPALTAAERGDFASLRTDVAARERLGTLGNGEAADLARAVAAWDVAHASKPDEQLARIRDVRACARDLDDALARRMKTHDAAGAEAAMARVDSGELSEGSAREYLKDAEDGWRAVGARGLVRGEDDAARVRAYGDPAPAVRRAAMHAAAIAKDPRDVDALSEAARVDPEPIVRTDAVRTLGAIGGAGVVAKLRDLWTSADEPLREDIAAAWARGPTWSAGGREELRVLLAEGRGPGAIEAAGVVLREASRDPELDASATALLTRTIEKASHRDRLHAVAIAPHVAGPILEALRAAAKDLDITVRVAVLARLLESPPDRGASLESLETIAGTVASSPASRAKLALAEAGDLHIQAWIESDLVAPEPSVRLGAAMALAALGRSGRAAPLLADSDPSVRTRAACTLILASHARHH
jgi:HEAT repeat protein